MTPSIVTSTVKNSLLAPSTALPSKAATSHTSNRAETAGQCKADELSLTQPQSLPASDGVYQRASLTIRAQSRTNMTDDGHVQTNSQAKLRFRYTFEAADGTKIRIRTNANLRYSQRSGGDGESQSTKLRVAVRVSVLQGQVASGASPLLESPDTSTDARGAVAKALDLFRDTTDAVTSLFLESDPLDGDSLVGGLAEAFNGLSEAIGAIFAPPADPEATLPGETGELPPPLPVEPGEVPPIEPAPVESAPPAPVDVEPLPPVDVEPSIPVDTEPLPVDVEPVLEPPLQDADLSVEPAPTESSVPSAESVMVRLRLQVIQSLTNLVGEFDSDSPGLAPSHSIFRASAQFSASYQLGGTGDAGALANDSGIDTQV